MIVGIISRIVVNQPVHLLASRMRARRALWLNNITVMVERKLQQRAPLPFELQELVDIKGSCIADNVALEVIRQAMATH